MQPIVTKQERPSQLVIDKEIRPPPLRMSTRKSKPILKYVNMAEVKEAIRKRKKFGVEGKC